MILDTLTKFNMRRKLWMTPEHPLSTMPGDFKVMYSAALILQAQVAKKTGMLNNYELERLVKAGFKMGSTDFAWALRTSGDNAAVVDYLLDNLKTDRERSFFIMDLVNVSINDGDIEEDSRKSIELFAKMFGVPSERTSLLQRFIDYAYGEDIRECQRFAALIEERIPGIGIQI